MSAVFAHEVRIVSAACAFPPSLNKESPGNRSFQGKSSREAKRLDDVFDRVEQRLRSLYRRPHTPDLVETKALLDEVA